MNNDLMILGVSAPILIVSVVQLLKVVFPTIDSRTAPLVSLGMGVVCGIIVILLRIPEIEGFLKPILLGLFSALAASGFYSQQKAVRGGYE